MVFLIILISLFSYNSLTCELVVENFVKIKENTFATASRDNIELANDCWNKFIKEQEWFFEYDRQSIISHESELKAINQWDTELKDIERLKKHILESNDAFIRLREQAAQSVLIRWGDSSYAFSMYSKAYLDLTESYVDYMREMLFPKGWPLLYESYLNKHSSSLE